MKFQKKAVEAAKVIRQVVRTSTETADIIMAALVTGSHLLLNGPPGTGKTLLSSSWGKMFAGSEAATGSISQVKKKTPTGQASLFDMDGETSENGQDLLASMDRPAYALMRFSVGTQAEQLNGNLALSKLMKGEEVPVFREHLKAAIFHADEANRATPPVSSLMMQHLGENQASIGHYTVELPRRMAILTVNPNGSGTFDMDEALIDRMAASVTVEFMSAEDLEDTGLHGTWTPEVPTIGTVEDLLAIWDESVTIPWDPEARTMAAQMIRATTSCKLGNKAELLNFPACCADCDYAGSTSCCKEVTPVGVRAHKSLEVMAAGYAYLRGDASVKTKHLQIVAPYVLRHRVQYLAENGTKQSLARAKELTNRLVADASQAVDLITRARQGKLKRKELDTIRQGKLQSLLTLESLPRIERLLSESVQQVTVGDPATMTVAELKLAIDQVPEDHVGKFEAELKARQVITGVIEDEGSISDPFFRETIVTPEGDKILSDAMWEQLVITRQVESDLIPGVKVSIKRDGAKLVLNLDMGTPEVGELYREHLKQNPISGLDTGLEEEL